jgi:hypothetical protein
MNRLSVDARMLVIARQCSQNNGPCFGKFKRMKINFLLRISDLLSDVRLEVLEFL